MRRCGFAPQINGVGVSLGVSSSDIRAQSHQSFNLQVVLQNSAIALYAFGLVRHAFDAGILSFFRLLRRISLWGLDLWRMNKKWSAVSTPVLHLHAGSARCW